MQKPFQSERVLGGGMEEGSVRTIRTRSPAAHLHAQQHMGNERENSRSSRGQQGQQCPE